METIYDLAPPTPRIEPLHHTCTRISTVRLAHKRFAYDWSFLHHGVHVAVCFPALDASVVHGRMLETSFITTRLSTRDCIYTLIGLESIV